MNGLQRICVRTINGTIQIGARMWRWPWETKEGRERFRRVGVSLTAAWSLYRLAGRWHWIAAVAITVALICAYRAADEVVDGQDEDEETASNLEAVSEPTVEQLQGALVATVLRLADSVGRVHLDRILIGWQEAGLAGRDMTLSDFRKTVEHLGVPVRDSVKVAGVVRIGVHTDDLTQAQLTDSRTLPKTTPPVVPDDLLQDW